MVVCRYFQQGNCRFGNNCKFEHPRDGGSGQQSPFGGGNRFSALSGGQQNAFGGSKPSDQPEYAGLNEETIRKDLANELPQWIFSCYGPGKDAPDNLFGGYPREQQPEEIRLHFMKGQAAGEADAALNEIMQLHTVARQQIDHTLSNIPAAIQHVRDGINRHPNRHDICKQGTPPSSGPVFGQPAANPFQNSAQPASNPFGAPAQPPAAGGFGQPAALGQKPNPFGAPAFGQPAQPAATSSAFGQPAAPSAFGQPAAPSAFGQPAAPSAFGQPAALGASTNPFGKPAGAFGQPSALGGASKVFGQAATPAFGQSGFGQTTQAPSAFGQPAALGATQSPFAAAAASNAQQTPSPFGQPQQPAQNASPFGQPAAPAANPFGQPAANPSPFTATQPAAAPAANPFGQPQQPAQNAPSPFGQPAAAPAANPFGQPAQPAAAPSPFGQPATATVAPSPFGQTTTAPAPSPFGVATAAVTQPTPQQGQGPYGPGATRSHPPLSSYASNNPDGTLRMFKGKPVIYDVVKSQGEKPIPVIKNFDGTIQKIWNPNGAPNYTTETEAEPERYNDSTVQSQWAKFVETGRFDGGIMPEVPPKREFCVWDF
ncbi:hypothetical protein B0T21DRAFT_358041 [Apiosordaria backusii]|uniref:C3H1-type domain-containing protein n=1 Tax=Apiosordaria backusii TaxID=314023 RepID=A0AA40K3I3_9PEZI|nr:hypothetical protein B0T21DRAFT_358041 [Apiosordaria backusii]